MDINSIINQAQLSNSAALSTAGNAGGDLMFGMDSNTFILALVLSFLGMGYWMYGKSDKNMIVMTSGGILMFMPYVVTSFYGMLSVSIAVIAGCYFFTRG